MELLKKILSEVSKEEMNKTMHWLTENTPYRLAGSDDERRAAEYVTNRMKEYGLKVTNNEFYTYNSDPQYSKVRVISPEAMEIDSLPCAHIRATAPEGEEFELVYAGNGSYESYEGLDVKGKLLLVEVSYAPPVPEKARIAYEMGAAGIVCMNWGNDEEVICNRGLKAVWGNPTEETFGNIPDVIGVGITRLAGLKLKEWCLAGEKVKLHVTAIATREWSKVHEPQGILRGNGKSDDFLLVCSHLDAWKPGVTCNATGNATTLEICRLFAKYRESLDRNVYFLFWNGHEIAEAAGSTWFVDQNWDLLQKNCISYTHIDSTGVRETEIFEIKASRELLNFAKESYFSIEGEKDIRAMALKKIGDQSFMGIGIPSITQRMSFTQEYMDKAHGATLGWWNHTKEDGLDKCDIDTLVTDTKVTLAVLYQLANTKALPYEYDAWFEEIKQKVEDVDKLLGKHLDITSVKENIIAAQKGVNAVQTLKDKLDDAKLDIYNRYVKNVSHLLSNVFLTYADKYQQDSYGHTRLSSPIPLFAEASRLEALSADSLEYGMVLTQLTKNRNRINEALYEVQELSYLALLALK